MEYKKKLIEVALPLEAINAAAAYEKMPGIGPHPRGIHLWWARRPFVAARAVLWASLVDDPSSHPDQFPTEESQKAERKRLFDILSRLVPWGNSSDEEILDEAKKEISKCVVGELPELLDPFAGGGAIPLEAQRLGMKAHANDLNPVAVMINKAMIELPYVFGRHKSVNPSANSSLAQSLVLSGPESLSEDIRYYGKLLRDNVFKKIGNLYPKIDTSGNANNMKNSDVIAWIWTRTVKCPNPACGCEMPLASSFQLSKRKGREAYIDPSFDYANKKIIYRVKNDNKKPPETGKTSRGAKFKCIMCGESTTDDYIKNAGITNQMGSRLMAIVAEGKNGRVYLSPTAEQEQISRVELPDNYPEGCLTNDTRALWCSLYGLHDFYQLFTNRQLTALTTFSDGIRDILSVIENDAILAGFTNDHIPISAGGSGAKAYSEVVATYLAFAIDRLADFSTSVARWSVSNEKAMNCFNRQGIPMTWDFPETNIMGTSVGGFIPIVDYIADCVKQLPQNCKKGVAKQFDAQSDNGLRNIMISTDPPYYDNICYADLSDFFYVWLRRSLQSIYPNLFRTMLVPKAEELVATPFRFDGSTEKAKSFFEDGMYKTCCQIYQYAREDFPVTIYYAFKQSDTDANNQTSSSGWETMLSAIIRSGFAITGTWPMRTEQAYRSVSMGTNALASSIILVCRKRFADAGSVTRREFINALHREMRPALEALQSANIAPVDLAQSAIGPGIGVFSRYKSVIESDGSPMSVRAALQIINQELDAFYNEQEGELDAKSRFCVDIFNQYAFNTLKFGDADILARAKNTSVQALVDEGVMEAVKGTVSLKTRDAIPEKIDANEDCCWKITQQLARAMERGGVKECAAAVVQLNGYRAENAKALAYRLYTICERKNWAAEGYAYNNMIVAWPDIQSEAARLQVDKPVQMSLFDQE